VEIGGQRSTMARAKHDNPFKADKALFPGERNLVSKDGRTIIPTGLIVRGK
jgi:hypothetical protein